MWQTSDIKGSPLVSLGGRLDRTHKVISGPSKTRDGWHETSVGNLHFTDATRQRPLQRPSLIGLHSHSWLFSLMGISLASNQGRQRNTSHALLMPERAR